MKPGRELDALVAMHVTGWRLEHHKDPDGDDIWHIISPDGKHVDSDRSDTIGAFEACKNIPNYSTQEDAAAFDLAAPYNEIINFFYNHGYGFAYGIFEGRHQAWFRRRKGDPDWTEGETMPHAICLAALKAVGVDIT